MVQIGSLAHAPTKVNYALPRGLSDEPPREKLEEFRKWIKKGLLNKPLQGKRPPRYFAEYETLDKSYDLGFMAVEKKSWFYELATSPVWLWDEHIDVAFYYLRKKIMQFPELVQRKITTVDTFFSAKVSALWRVYKNSEDNFDWGSCDSLIKIIKGNCVRCGLSWFDVNTLLIPMHVEDLKHWVLVKLDLLNWIIEVYDSLHYEGIYNHKVLDALECMAFFIPMLVDLINLFKSKPRSPPGIYPIPIINMQDIPRQENEGDCGIFIIKYAECLIEGKEVRYWVIQERMHMFREWLTYYLWCHAKRKIEDDYKSDDEFMEEFLAEHSGLKTIENNQNELANDEDESSLRSSEDGMESETAPSGHECGQMLVVPQCGMEFPSEEQAYNFYKNYSAQLGFKVRKGKVQRKPNGTIQKRIFLCSKEGERSKKISGMTPRYKRKETRTGCKAEIRIGLKNGKWVIYSCYLGHNHELERPGQRHEMDTYPDNSQVVARESTGDGAQVVDKEGGTAGNRSPEEVRVSNYLPDKNVAKLAPDDVQSLLNCFRHLQAKDPSFFYAIQVNSEIQITSFFWRDGRSRMDYDYFGDVVVLDTCRYQIDNNVICAPFFGVNRHKRPVLFGCAFLLDETGESFRWLFKTFLEAMGDSQPKTLFTALSEDIAGAAEKIFPETKHCIAQSLICEELRQKHLRFLEKVFDCLAKARSKQVLEETWNLSVEECELQEDPWLAFVYKSREKWSPLFSEVLAFTADFELLTDLVHCFDIFPDWKNTTLSVIFEEYLKTTEEFRSDELSEDFKSNGVPSKERIGMDKHAADVYTSTAFEEFECEFEKIISLAMEEVSPGTCVQIETF